LWGIGGIVYGGTFIARARCGLDSFSRLPHLYGIIMQIQQVVVTGKNEVSLQPVTIETKNLGPNELLIETERSFISAGTELANYTAADKNVYVPGSWCAYPWKSGYANVGLVLEAGERYRSLIGKRVYTNGQHAAMHRYETDIGYKLVAPVPEGLSLDEAVAARMAMVAMAGLDSSKPQYIRTVVVIGLGMVGNMAAQLFRLTGAQVIGVDPSATRRRLAKECGIPHAITGTEAEIIEQVKAINGGKLATVTVDAVGHSAIALQAVHLTASGGEVIVLGSPRCDVPGNLSDIFSAAHYRWVTIKGSLEWNIPTESVLEREYSQQTRLAGIFGWIGDGRLKLKPLITHVLPPSEIKTAYDGLLNKKEEYVGVVLKWK
jgi:2-desacetyl-2-hydroxyethyl bacteriochlorophyllide A dehydrogenase